MKFFRHPVLRYTTLIVFNLLVIESVMFGYLLFLILQGNCFFLIGNQKGLDALIKIRLIEATYFAQGKKNFINQLDNTLGYTIGENKDLGPYQSNAQGLRANRNYSSIPNPNLLRIAVFGDSFVFCDGEKNSDTWAYLLEQSVHGLEVLNLGVPGYGLGQSYLRYLKDGLKFSPDIIFFNYTLLSDRDRVSPSEWAGSDNIRMAHLYRVRFRIENGVLLSQATTPYELFDPSFREKYLFQPLGIDSHARFWSWKFFSISNTGLALKQMIYRRWLAKHASQGEYHNDEINYKILEHLLLTAEQNKSTFIFSYDRDFSDLPQRIQSLIKEHSSRVIYVNAQKVLQKRYAALGKDRTPYKRLSTPQLLYAPEDLLNSSGHFNAQGNRIFADVVLEILKTHPLGENDRKFQFDEQNQTFRNTSVKNP